MHFVGAVFYHMYYQCMDGWIIVVNESISIAAGLCSQKS